MTAPGSTARLFNIEGAVALVTGATGALGSAVSRGLAEAGARVMLTGRRAETLQPLAAEIAASGGIVDFCAGQPDQVGDVRRVVEATTERLGGIDILVTTQGMNNPKPIIEQPVEEWEAIVDSHLKATWLFCREVGRAMIRQGRGGRVILIGSQRGELGMPNYSAYSPAKAAIHLLTKTLAWEWGPYGIRVNCIAPGLFRSRLTEWMWGDEEVYKRLLTRIPIGRLGEPDDMVGAVIYLASPASDFVTGAVLHVDGGYTAG